MRNLSFTDWAIYALAALSVALLGAAAAIVSYSHVLELALGHGQSGRTAHLTPLTVDGLVFVPSLVSLAAARRREKAPALAHIALALGIAATGAANVIYGLEYGLLGAAVAGWPAVALVLSHHLLMGMIRRGRPVAAESDGWDEAWASVQALLADVAPRPVPVAAVRPALADLPPVELPVLPVRTDVGQTAAERPAPVGSVAVAWLAPPVVEGVEEVADGHEVSHVGEVSGAGQAAVTGLDSAIVAARKAGGSLRSIAAEFKVSKYRVEKILEGATV